jgi:hypothetical protein
MGVFEKVFGGVFESLKKKKLPISLRDTHVRCSMSNEVLWMPYVPLL